MDKDKKHKKNVIKPDAVFSITTENELMKFLIEALPGKNKNNIKSLLVNDQVEVDGKVVNQYNFRLKAGNQVKIKWERSPIVAKSFRGFSIVFEDDYLIVIDKHAGVLSHSEGSLLFSKMII